MKTSQSFFQTRTHLKSRQGRHEHTYGVIRVKEFENSKAKIQKQPINIFRDIFNPPTKQETDKLQFRPVGGSQLIKKVEQSSKEKYYDNKRLSKRSIKDRTQKNITSNRGQRFNRDPEDTLEVSPLKSIIENKEGFHKSATLLPQELLKSHATYDPYTSVASVLKIRNSTFTGKTTYKSQNIQRPVTSIGKRHDSWAANQRQQYQDISAVLNEISFKKPVVQLYGDRYFEYMLRNRFEDDLKPKPYIYIISKDNKQQNKTVSKLRQYRPDIKQKQMMFLKGRKLKLETQQL